MFGAKIWFPLSVPLPVTVCAEIKGMRSAQQICAMAQFFMCTPNIPEYFNTPMQTSAGAGTNNQISIKGTN